MGANRTACWLIVVGVISFAAAPLAHAADKSGTRPTAISVPKGPGSVEGLGESFQVNLNSGSVAEVVALKVPPGTAGQAPQLALSYDSGQGNGPLGLGWTLGLPTIQLQTEKGLPKYDGTDVLLLQGAELVPVAQGVYRLKNESRFVRVRTSSLGFEVDLPSGETQRFGISSESRIESGEKRYAWFLEDEIDAFGNRVSYSYTKDEGGIPTLARIDYNLRAGAAANAVDFIYESRPDALADYRPTFRTAQPRRLKEVRMLAQGVLQRKYVLTYAMDTGVSLLRTRLRVAASNQFRAHPRVFVWLPDHIRRPARWRCAPPGDPARRGSTSTAPFTTKPVGPPQPCNPAKRGS